MLWLALWKTKLVLVYLIGLFLLPSPHHPIRDIAWRGMASFINTVLYIQDIPGGCEKGLGKIMNYNYILIICLYFISNTVARVTAVAGDLNFERQPSIKSLIFLYILWMESLFFVPGYLFKDVHIEDGNGFFLQGEEGRSVCLYKKDNVFFWAKMQIGFLASCYKLIGFP